MIQSQTKKSEKKYSTGALTAAQHAQQNQLYREQHTYDYLIIGTGMSALTAAALLANAGSRVCLLEAHDIPGGYAHTFTMNDFSFCAQVHYIWGCAPGQPLYNILKHLNLHEEIIFEPLNPEGYDQVILPNQKRVKIPYGYDKLMQNIDAECPGQKNNLRKFLSILERLQSEMSQFPPNIHWWNYITDGYKFLGLLKYKDKTLQNVFDECHLNQEVQTILSANAGDFGSPPNELSVLAYAGLFGGYNGGAYYPKKHFKFLIDRLAQFITDHKGCHIYYETEVVKINSAGNLIKSIETSDGKIFTAEKILCNMDPQKASYLLERDKFTKRSIKSLSYEYSPASFIIYLGIKGIDLRDYGFGNHNTWHLEQWDMNQSWKDIKKSHFERPWLFMSTPTLHTSEPGMTPEGCQILEVCTAADFGYFHALHEQDPHQYRHQKRELAESLLNLVEKRHIPNLQQHIALKVVGTPTTNLEFCYAPLGNAYGSLMTPNNMGLNRLKADTPWKNFFWCNASSGYPSIYGTAVTGANLYMQLTGDRFL